MCNRTTLLVLLLGVVAIFAAICMIIAVVETGELQHVTINPTPPPTYDPYNISKTTVRHESGIESQERNGQILDRFIDESKP